MRIHKFKEVPSNNNKLDITKIPLCQKYIDLIVETCYKVSLELNTDITKLDLNSYKSLINSILEEKLANE